MSRQQEYNERKLKPIYDYLDNGYYKKSLQEIEKLLKKAKDWQYLKVLKALTYIRMGRQKDGNEILNEIFSENPTDDSTLQTMSICYRELQQNNMIASIYENALKKDPSSEKLFTHLFMAYVRMQDYKKQQLTALNLYKVCPKNPYYFWAIMSIYMQAISSNDDIIAAKITLPLAEKMCQKFYNDNKFEADQEIDLYLMILERQKKYSDMIDLIDAPSGKYRMNDPLGFVLHRKVQLLKKEGRLAQAFDDLMDLIKKNNDQYDYYIELYNLSLLLDKPINENEESCFQYTLQLLNLVDELCNSKPITNETNTDVLVNGTISKRSLRGPFIAKIIISNLIQQSAKQVKDQNAYLNYHVLLKKIDIFQRDDFLINLVFDYFQIFSSKYVCVKDIIYILENLEFSQEQIQLLLVKIKMSLVSLDQEDSLDDINKSLCYQYLVHYNSDLSVNFEGKLSELTALFRLYRRTFDIMKQMKTDSTSNETGEKTNSVSLQQPFDPIIYLMANKISAGIDIYNENSLCNLTIFDLIAILESALAKNSYDFYCKLLLVRLYNSIGAASTSHALYETLDIKLIQNDTLGHYFLFAFLTTGLFSLAQQFLNSSWKFYSFNFKEASDFIINFYKNGAFTKIEEITAFNYKLRNSLQYHLTFIEKLYLNLLTECKNHLSFTNFANDCIAHIVNGNFDIEWDKICDNRDLQLLSSNHHKLNPYVVDTLRAKTCNDEILWLRYRFALFQALTVATYLSENLFSDFDKLPLDNGEDKKAQLNNEKLSLNSFAKLIQQLEELFTVAKSTIEKSSIKYCIEGPAPSKLNSYFKNMQCLSIFSLLNYLLGIFKYCTRSDQEINSLTLELSDIFSEFFNDIETLQNNQSLQNIRQILENITNWTETFSICISLLDIAFSTAQKFIKTSKRSKKKKSNDGPQFKDCEQVIGIIVERISSLRVKLEDALKRLSVFQEKSIDNLDVIVSQFQLKFASKLEDVTVLENSIKAKLNSSYTKSFSELAAVLQIKQKYLSLAFSNEPQKH